MAESTKVLLFTLFFLSFSGVYTVTVAVVEDHPRCLRELKDSLIDPLGSLKSWNTLDSSSVCGVAGVSCWINSDERVISLELQGKGLSGHLPDALKYCSFSLHHLNLSGNSLFGSIPSEICSWMPYLVTLDLSNNSFSGSIPAELGKCTYLNNIMLNNNELTGNIPQEISSLRRLKVLCLSNNDLSGSIAPFFQD
ncbi:inactive LRR receptor-like serine/threonine-protein kinase BIR2 [Lycium ferocissimum]|uniref:inactive LRR receptor-like serine/threonine-protein kinase BIR2 n=1 Tax=Lycium ferocissimum TaxID=112874 RepID=UPI002814CAC5|nr:inactive LRR receptor-like serine/threonine-protein kinase BIR2 [Lycium ferocissimum]